MPGAEKVFLFAIGLAVHGSNNCPQWENIKPCSCRNEFNSSFISVSCEEMNSFGEVVQALQNKFSPTDRILLTVSFSKLDDLPRRAFKELNVTIETLKLNYDNLSADTLSAQSFVDLPKVNYFSLADNDLGFIPTEIFEKLPGIKSLDLGRIGVHHIKEGVFKSLPYLQHLVLAGNDITKLDVGSIPATVRKLHLGRNMISDLNRTLVPLTEMDWLFLNNNNLGTLANQLPRNAHNIIMIHGAYNMLEEVPNEIKNYQNLQSLFLNNNVISMLGTTVSKLTQLQRLQLEHNRISELSPETFAELQRLESLLLGYNLITSINGAILPLRRIRGVNLTHNLLSEFSLEEIKGLQMLELLDLSHNKIKILYGPAANLVEWETKLTELKLNHNHLESLNGALSGLPSLTKLDLSHNKITAILPDDFIGLDQLTELDISHNQLSTLQEMSKTYLPSLSDLLATHNKLTVLDRDFHGLPVLCWADLSSNQIVALGRELVSNTKCHKHGKMLKVYLQYNPILCDAAFPEISAAMKKNFTILHGASHCAPLSEQPTTSKPNGYFGILPFSTPIPLRTIYNQNTSPNVNSPMKQPIYQTLTAQKQPSVSVDYQQPMNMLNTRSAFLFQKDENHHFRHHPIQQGTSSNYNVYPQYLYRISDQLEEENNDTKDTLPLVSSLDTKDVNRNSLNEEQPSASLSRATDEENVTNNLSKNAGKDKSIPTVADKLSKQEELSRLEFEIEELKKKVQELSEQAQRINMEEGLAPAIELNQSAPSTEETLIKSTGDVRTPK